MRYFLWIIILRSFQPDSLTNVVSGGQFVRYVLAQEKIDRKWPPQTSDHPNPEILTVNPQRIFLWFKVLGQMYNPTKYYIHRNVWEKDVAKLTGKCIRRLLLVRARPGGLGRFVRLWSDPFQFTPLPSSGHITEMLVFNIIAILHDVSWRQHSLLGLNVRTPTYSDERCLNPNGTKTGFIRRFHHKISSNLME
jgi:hypothetical protein